MWNCYCMIKWFNMQKNHNITFDYLIHRECLLWVKFILNVFLRDIISDCLLYIIIWALLTKKSIKNYIFNEEVCSWAVHEPKDAKNKTRKALSKVRPCMFASQLPHALHRFLLHPSHSFLFYLPALWSILCICLSPPLSDHSAEGGQTW